MNKKNRLFRWLSVCLIVLIGVFLSLDVSVNDNAMDLLPDGAVRGDLQKLQQIGLVDRLFITLSADKKKFPDENRAQSALKESAENLGSLLERSEQFTGVLTGIKTENTLGLLNELYRYLPVLLDDHDLSELQKSISRTAIDEALQQKFMLLNSPAGIGSAVRVQKDPLDFIVLQLRKLGYLRSEFSVQVSDGYFMSSDGRNCLILAESTNSLTDSNNAQTVLRELEQNYQKALVTGVAARVIGTLPHTIANSTTVKKDLHLLLPTAAVLLLLLLGTTLRDIRAVIVLSVPFLAAIPAIGLTSVIYGSVSGLALGFGIVLIGIAVDFSIHLYLALSRDSGSRVQVLKKIGRPIFFATMTTTSVFLVLFFSDVASHRQMATLALSGVLLAVLFAWLLIPAIVPDRKRIQNDGATSISSERYLAPWGRKMILILWIVLLLLGLTAWPKLRYNGDLRVLDAPDQKVVADEKFFKSVWGDKGEQAFVVSTGNSLAEALDSNDRVYKFLRDNNFNRFQTIGAVLHGPEVQQENGERWLNFWNDNRQVFKKNFVELARSKGFSDGAFKPFFHWLNLDPVLMKPDIVLESEFKAVADTMIRYSQPVADNGETGEYTVLTTVGVDKNTVSTLLDFAGTEESVVILANDKWRSEVEKLLKKDIVLLSLAAGCCVVLIVGMQFRNVRCVVAVLAPVLSALAAMSLFCWITSGQLNMMHLIMGIMVIGLSVDYGIFVVCSRIEGYSGVALFAVSVCAASSLIGFGVLAFADHPALHSLGITVLIGIGASWPTALLVSPYLLEKSEVQV